MLAEHHIRFMFATPSIVIVTLFVTFPLIAKSLIPTMSAQGTSEEQAALILGASTWQLFLARNATKNKMGINLWCDFK